jgi:cytochrome c oxidase assembly protein subunit 15
LVLFLVLIGGVVRSTGAGLGCPDWPKCFGLWIPPTSITEIPVQFWDHPLSSENGKVIFNPVKTWTEYLNRLLGVIIGFAILVQAVLAFFQTRGLKSRMFSVISLVLVLFQGWLGSRVVSSDLRPLIISFHLLVALLIALFLLLALYYSSERGPVFGPYKEKRYSRLLLVVVSFLLLIQFFLGTEVRSQVDAMFRQFDYGSREGYVQLLDWKFILHRSLSILTLLALVLQFWFLARRLRVEKIWLTLLPLTLVLFLLFSGIILIYLGFPAFAQPFHLLFGFSVVCAQFWLCLHYFRPFIGLSHQRTN